MSAIAHDLIKRLHCLALELPEAVWRDACLPVIDYLQRNKSPTPSPSSPRLDSPEVREALAVVEPTLAKLRDKLPRMYLDFPDGVLRDIDSAIAALTHAKAPPSTAENGETP
jgi:hypothetical protein